MSYEKEHILAQWLENPQNEENIVAASATHDLNNIKHHLDHIDKHHVSGIDINDSWSLFQQKLASSNTPKQKSAPIQQFRFRWTYLFLLLGLIGASFYGYTLYKESIEKQVIKSFHTDIAQSTVEYAPDSSKITIGSATSLKYYPARWPKVRELWLDGEAMFDVAKGSTFDVITPTGTASVLGTEFNVLSIDKSLTVTCYEGKVLLSSPSGNSAIISAGEVIKLTGEQFSDKKIHKATSPAWINGSLTYTSTPLSEIILDLNRYYTHKISLSPDIHSKRFTGVLPINDWDKMGQILASSMSLLSKKDKEGNVLFTAK